MSRFESEPDACPRGIDAGAYVLSALEADEAVAYGEHLHDCHHCQLEVGQLRLVVDTLPIAAPQVAPPAALKGRIMAVVEREAQLLQAAGPEADRPEAEPARAPWRTRLAGRFGSPVRPAFAGALACALLAVGVAGGFAIHGSDAPETRTLQAWAAGPATAQLKQTGDKAQLEVAGMPSLERGRVYQVWLDRGDGQFRPTHTLFNVRPDGRASPPISESLKGVDRIAVTVERSGGALAPSGAPVITASPA